VRPRAAPHLSDRLGRAPVHLPRRHLTDPFLQSRSCTSGNRARCCWSEPRISQSIMHSAESGADAEQPSPAPSRASANVDQIASTVIPCPQGAAHLASSPALPWR
jgi:hypothetical protein